MRLIVCLDDANGMLFRGRRQSKDRALRDRILQITEGTFLWMNGYSFRQFEQMEENIRISESFLEEAGEDDYCFLESEDILPYVHRVRQLIVYRWNELYPSDETFPMEHFTGVMKKHSEYAYAGNSHSVIIEEIYEKEK